MSLRTTLLCLFLMFGVIACSSPEQGEPTAEVAAPATETGEATVDAEAAVKAEPEADTTDAEDGAAETQGFAETEGIDDEADSEGDAIVFDEPKPATAISTTTDAWQFKEGDHYRRMTASQGTSSPPDKIEVAEVFWYGCSHCYNFEPLINDWKEQQPADVAFVRIPVIWNPSNEVHARAMYTAEALGVLDKAHPEIFKAIHQQNNSLTSQEGLATFFARLGVDNAAFVEAYNSFGVNSAVKRAENLTRRYGVRSVPVLIVNGKYGIDGPQVRTFGDMLNAAEELVQRERIEE